MGHLATERPLDRNKMKNISLKTGDMFHHLWRQLDDDQFKNSIELIHKRFKTNSFNEFNFKDKTVIDVGCGSGRYCIFASQLKAKKVIGIDSSKINIQYNKKKFKKFKNIKFIYGDNTNLKIRKNSADITISNGVIHHTTNMFKSMDELIRITKKGGKILLLVYGEYGYRWNLIKKLRPIANLIGKKEIIKIMKKKKFPQNNIKHFIDDLFVPILYQTKLTHLREYLKKKVKKVKVWSKKNTFDHEQNIESYLVEFKKLESIFRGVQKKDYKDLSLKIIKSYTNEINFIKKNRLSNNVKKYLIIGEGNHRLEITK